MGTAGPRRGAALLTTVLLVTAAATMSAVLVRQSLSLARAEAERLASDQVRQCVDDLQATMEAALASSPHFVLGGAVPPSLQGARVSTDAGTVLSGGDVALPGTLDSCDEGFNAAQHRIRVSLPSVLRPTLEVTYAAEHGAARYGRVVEYQLDSVSSFQVWSQELLELEDLFAPGPDPLPGVTTELAGAVYGASGVDLGEQGSPSVSFGRAGATDDSSPRHLQVFSPGPLSGVSSAPNLSIYTDLPGAARFPAGPSVQGRISSRTDSRVAGTGVRGGDASAAPAAPPRLELSQLVAQVSDRVALACDAGFGACLDAGQLLAPEVSRSRRPLGVVGLADPARGMNQQIGTELLVVPGHEVTLLSDGSRAYRVVSVLNPLSLVPGEVLTHQISRGQLDIQADRVPLASSEVASSSTQVAFDVPPAGLVTYTTRARFDTDVAGVNVSSAGAGSFLVVEDLGPAEGAPAPVDGSAGVRALARPASTSSGYGQSPLPASGQQVTFVAQAGRRYLLMSVVHPSSSAEGAAVDHELRSTSGGTSGAILVASAAVALGAAGEAVSHILAEVVAPAPGPVTYTTFLRFGAGSSEENRNVREDGRQPLLAVIDLGPDPAVQPEMVSAFPAGLVAGPVASPAGTVNDPGVAAVSFPAAATRLFKIEFSATEGHGGDGGPVRLDLVRTMGGVDEVVQRVMLPPGASEAWSVALDAPQNTASEVVAYRLEAVASGGVPAWWVSRTLSVHDAGRADGDISAAAATDGFSGVVGGARTVNRSLGLVAAAAAALDGQEFAAAPERVIGQEATFEAAGDRRYRITSILHPYSEDAGEVARHEIVRAGSSSGPRVLQAALQALPAAGQVSSNMIVFYDTPAPGQVTYSSRASFTLRGAVAAGAGARSMIVVEDVGPAVGAIVPDDGGAAGLVGQVGHASPQTAESDIVDDWVSVPGLEVSFAGQGQRQYQVVSSIRPFALPDAGGGHANSAGHRLIRIVDGVTEVLSEHRVDLASAGDVFSHTFTYLDVPLAPETEADVIYQAQVRFFGGPGRNYQDSVFRPLLAVQDAGPVQPTSDESDEPRGVVGVGTQSATVQATDPSGELQVMEVTVEVPGGRLYRISSVAHPAFESADFQPAPFGHTLLRVTGAAEALQTVVLQSASGVLQAPEVGFSHQIEAFDAPSASEGTVTYRALLVFSSEGGSSVSAGDVRPQLLVEDLGAAAEGTPFGFTAETAPLQLAGSEKLTLLSRVPEDVRSFLLTLRPDEDGRTTMLVETCPSVQCSPSQVSGSFAMSLPDSGLVVATGHVTLSGESNDSFTLISGTLSRPADLVVSAATVLRSPVQLVATDRLLVKVPDGYLPARLDADLVALGLDSEGPVLGPSGAAWLSMLTLAGSVAGPEVDVRSAFETAGPVRLEPRAFSRQAPWAVGFSGEWRATAVRLAGRSEVALLFAR